MPKLTNITKLFKSTCAEDKNSAISKTLKRLSVEIHSAQEKLNAITGKRKGLHASPTNAERTLSKIIREKTREHNKISRSCNN
jgi:hypothetical protein